MQGYKNPHSNHVRRLLNDNRPVIEYALEVWKEFHDWPKYRTLAHRFDISVHHAKSLVGIAILSIDDPQQYQVLMALPPPLPAVKKTIEDRPVLAKKSRNPSLQYDLTHATGDSVVYFVLCRHYGVVKIGYASKKRLPNRISQLQIGNWTSLELIACIDGRQKEERAIHKHYSQLRIRGEWFRYEEPLISFIESIKPK